MLCSGDVYRARTHGAALCRNMLWEAHLTLLDAALLCSGDVYRARIHGATLCACKVFQLHSVTSMANRHKYFMDVSRCLGETSLVSLYIS